MKKLKSLTIMLLAVCVFYACRKNDNPKLPDGIYTTVLPQLTNDSTGDVLIQDMTKFKAVIDVNNYFPNSVKAKEWDLYITKNGNNFDRRLFKKLTGTFPVQVTLTGQDLATLFGLDINNVAEGTYFTLSSDITLNDGTFLPGFKYGINSTGDTTILAPYGADALNFPDFTPTQVYKKACPLNMHLYAQEQAAGGSTMTVNDPDFWEDIYDVHAYIGTGKDTTLITIQGWIQDPTATVKLYGDAKTQNINVPRQTYAATLNGTSYTKPTMVGKGAFNTCDTTLSITVTNTVDQGGFGSATISIYPAK